MFHKLVLRRIYGVVGYIIITLLQIVRRVCQWKNFENWSLIDEDMDKSKVPHGFYGLPCRCGGVIEYGNDFELLSDNL